MEPETRKSDEFPGFFFFFLHISWSLGAKEVRKPEMLADTDTHTYTPQQKSALSSQNMKK